MVLGRTRFRRRRFSIAAAAGAVVLAALLGSAVDHGLASAARQTPAAATPLLPSADTFYDYRGKVPLARRQPGQILARRSVTVTLPVKGVSRHMVADQVLYRTTGQNGRPTATVTTVIRQQRSAGLISYDSFYDGLGPGCDPSFTLRYGVKGAPSLPPPFAEASLIGDFVNAGYDLAIPDFEGESQDWTAGLESGRATLDGVRAAEADLTMPASTPVGLFGYSGGTWGTDWAAELAATYAPELRISGVAEGGVPVDLAHILSYVSGSPAWGGVIPAVLAVLPRDYGLNIGPLLTPAGAAAVRAAGSQCLRQILPKNSGVALASLLKPNELAASTSLGHVLHGANIGQAGRPGFPMLLGIGQVDGTGDGVVPSQDVEGLARHYCDFGVPVEFARFQGVGHSAAALPFTARAMSFFAELRAGKTLENDCSTTLASSASSGQSAG